MNATTGILASYRARLVGGAPDALVDGVGTPWPQAAQLAATMDLLGSAGLRARSAQAQQLLENDGVTYGDATVGPGRALSGSWRLDPLPVLLSSAEWENLAAGLDQRARLLDRILADLYGPRDLLRRGLLPVEAVMGHAGFIRGGTPAPGAPRQRLTLLATDLARTESGWCVLDDRTQAPSGAGYAMQNRRIVARVMPGLYTETRPARLREFFHTLRAGLQAAAPASAEAPRVVILSPGPQAETYFDQAFLATLLGFPLVEGEDLQVRGGRVWLRTVDGPEAVDVVVRRVDAWFSDPLELRPDSRLGVPGLMEAARLGNVALVNPPGSGVLENPALLPYLPALAKALLGEHLRLASTPTWWCGQPSALAHVLPRMAELVLRPIARSQADPTRFGWLLTAAQRSELAARIKAQPWAWCAQLPVAVSTAPVITGAGELDPRRLGLRCFSVGATHGYRVLPGGLGRVAGRHDSLDVRSVAGGLAKDVWVLADEPIAAAGGLPPRPAPVPLALRTGALSARVAEDMFWLGRYCERAEDFARLLRVTADLAGDHAARPGTVGARGLSVMLQALTQVSTVYPGFLVGASAPVRQHGSHQSQGHSQGHSQGQSQRSAGAAAIGAADLSLPWPELGRLVSDASVPGTLAHAVRRMAEVAMTVREQLSADTWVFLGGLSRVLAEVARRPGEVQLYVQPVLSRVLEGVSAMSGLAGESMMRDHGWYLMDAGRRIERALQLVALLRATLVEERSPEVDDLVSEAVLTAAESVITHRRRNPGRPRPETVLDLLLLDRDNPRGLIWQLDRLAEDLERLPKGAAGSPGAPAALLAPREQLLAVRARLRERAVIDLVQARSTDGALLRVPLAEHLAGINEALRSTSDLIAEAYFARLSPPQPMAAGARAVVAP